MFQSILLGITVLTMGSLLVRNNFRKPQAISLSDVSIFATAIFFGLGWIVSALTPGDYYTDDILNLPYRVLALIVIFMAFVKFGAMAVESRGLGGVGRLGIAAPLREYLSPVSVLSFYGVAILAKIYMAVRYTIFFSGRADAAIIENIPYVVRASFELVEFIQSGCLLWAAFGISRLRHGDRDGIDRLAVITVLLGEAFFAFANGRTSMIIVIFVIGFAMIISGYKIISRKMLIYLGSAAIVVGVMFPIFFLAREAYTQFDDRGTLSAFSGAVQAAYSGEASAYGSDVSGYRENVRGRTISGHQFLDRILEQESAGVAPAGNLLLRNMVRAVPQALGVDKLEMVSVEDEINRYFNFPLEDATMTIPAAGLADLGMLGVAIYGLLLGFFVEYVPRLFRSLGVLRGMLGYMLMGQLLVSVVRIEADPVWIPQYVRDAIILIVAFGIFGLRNGAQRGSGMERPSGA